MEFDIDKIKSFLDSDEKFVAQLFSGYITESTECIDGIQQAYKNKEWRKIRGLTHKMLGSCRIFFIDELINLLEKMEEDAENQTNLEKMENNIKNLILLQENCIDSMEEFIKRHN